ncbi:MAG: glycoside hydrolase [Chloroflexi bacterium]|nr:MAG: glycoside hydrolase [Chloroflexota bacterium]
MMKRFWLACASLLFFSFFSMAAPADVPADVLADVLGKGKLFVTDVPLIDEQQLDPGFWLAKIDNGDRVLLSNDQIAARNAETFRLQREMQPLAELPLQYSRAALIDIIDRVSAVPTTPRFYAAGRKLTTLDWQRYRANLALPAVKDENPLQFGLIVKRTPLLAFPSDDRVLSRARDNDLNRFQETGLFPAEPVAVLHTSADDKWLLVQTYNYTGWVRRERIAIGPRRQVLDYADKTPFLVVTGAKVTTSYNPEQPALSELQLDMGVRLPLLSAAKTGFNVHGQNPLASHIVQLPVRAADGSLLFSPALIPRGSDVHKGYLPYTGANIVRQAFKFLGERYGWGHDYNGRDCTGFIGEVYRSFGLLMPRNSGEQGKGDYGRNIRFDPQHPIDDKLKTVRASQPGDLLYLPGHVAMYLGQIEGQPFIIHDAYGLSYLDSSHALYQGILNGVMVTPLLPLRLSAEASYLDRMYAVKSLR